MTILRCGRCSIDGVKQNLAEVLPDGGIKILRSNPYQQDYTIIHGSEFQVSCGKCGDVVFYKYPKIADNPMTREVILRKTFQFYGTFVGGTL